MTSDNFWRFLIPSTYNVWPFLSQSIPIDILAHDYFIWFYFDPHFLCWISRVAPFNTWLISNWEENDCCYKLSKCTKWHLFHSNWSKLSFWVKIVVILSVAQLVITVMFFSAWDKSPVKWDNYQNSTQKMRTLVHLAQ